MSYQEYRQPWGSNGYSRSQSPAIRNIIIINILMMILTYLSGDMMYEKFALYYPSSPFFKPWQVLTHMFMHGGFWHLLFNMYTLYIFGTVLERVWGSKKFLIFYFVTGLGAAAIHTGVEWIQMKVLLNQVADGSLAAMESIARLKYTPTVGASGAIYGVLMGYAMLYPDSLLTLIFPPVTLKAKWFVLIFGGIELAIGLSSANDGVAHFAHLGGMLFGYLLIRFWKKRGDLYSRG